MLTFVWHCLLYRLHILDKLEESCIKVIASKIECIVHQTTDGRERFEAEILREAIAIDSTIQRNRGFKRMVT